MNVTKHDPTKPDIYRELSSEKKKNDCTSCEYKGGGDYWSHYFAL